MATNSLNFTLKPHPVDFSRSLFASITILVFIALVAFSFVPISFEAGLTYGYLNLSFIPLVALCAVAFCFNLIRRETDHIFVTLLIIVLTAISQIIGTARSPAEHKSFGTPFLFVCSMLIAPAVLLMARYFPPSTLTRIVPRIVNWLLTFLVVECITRLIFSPYMPATAELDHADTFYLYKASLFFVDSNFVGIEILCLLSIMFAFRETIGRKRWLLVYLLLFATLSRASIAAGICQLFIFKFWRWRVWTLFCLLLSTVFIAVRLFIDYITVGADTAKAIDGSLSTKFFIVTVMMNIFQMADTPQKLCGVGAGNFLNLSGNLSAHTMVALFTIELGIGGSILFLVYLWILCRKCPVSIYLLILPVAINGLSLVSAAAMPFFFGALGLLGALRGTVRDGTGGLVNEVTSSEVVEG